MPGYDDRDVHRALTNAERVADARKRNTARMDGCPLETFLRCYVPDSSAIVGAWSDEVHRRKKWTAKETEYLVDNYGRMPYIGIAAVLGKPYNAVVRKAGRLGLQNEKSDCTSSRA